MLVITDYAKYFIGQLFPNLKLHQINIIKFLLIIYVNRIKSKMYFIYAN